MNNYRWQNINGKDEENYSMHFHPDMQDSEICLMKGLIVALSKKRDKLNIFEWGSGKSTVYFSGFLFSQQIPFSWNSGEHNRYWHNQLTNNYFNRTFKQLKPYVTVYLEEIKSHSDFKNVPKSKINKYVNLPMKAGLKFDLMLVDGRYRRLCILNAKKYLSNDGILVLLEAEREHYHCALDGYDFQTFIDVGYTWFNKEKKLWIASMNEDTLEYILDYIYDFRNLLPLGRNAFHWPAAKLLKKLTPHHKPFSHIK